MKITKNMYLPSELTFPLVAQVCSAAHPGGAERQLTLLRMLLRLYSVV